MLSVVGFRDLNVTYLLLPLWTLTGYEVLIAISLGLLACCLASIWFIIARGRR
jgi:hypothetical protein